jgi:hypothetical protein
MLKMLSLLLTTKQTTSLRKQHKRAKSPISLSKDFTKNLRMPKVTQMSLNMKELYKTTKLQTMKKPLFIRKHLLKSFNLSKSLKQSLKSLKLEV